jgi:hypothetical protein
MTIQCNINVLLYVKVIYYLTFKNKVYLTTLKIKPIGDTFDTKQYKLLPVSRKCLYGLLNGLYGHLND